MKLSILMAIANSSPVYPIMHWMIFQSKWRTRNLFSISANANDFMFSRIIMAFHVIVDFVWWCTADMPRLVNFLAAPEALKRVYTNLSSWHILVMAHTCLSFVPVLETAKLHQHLFFTGLGGALLGSPSGFCIFCNLSLHFGTWSSFKSSKCEETSPISLLLAFVCQHLFLWTPASFGSQNTIFTWRH